ncbi:hypothetical protein JZU46_02870 [bacterium]|nr:hypothetical protein [bacterium]
MKVRCKVCSNALRNVCKIKNVGIALNKSRYCDSFNYDLTKVKPISKMEATYIPYHLSNRKAYKKYAKEQAIIQQEFAKQAAVANGVKQNSFDCLKNYRATVQ